MLFFVLHFPAGMVLYRYTITNDKEGIGMLSIIASVLESPDDQERMREIYDHNEGLFYATALQYTSSRYDAEEIVQDSVVKLIKNYTTIRELHGCILAAYIVSTVRNTAINRLIKESRRAHSPLDIAESADVAAKELSMDELLILAEKRQQIQYVFGSLSDEDQFLLQGKYFLGQSDAELASQLGCKPSSIRMKLTRARRNALKKITEREGGSI